MNSIEARAFLHGCNDAMEAGMTPDLACRIREARAIVVADQAARRRTPMRAAIAGSGSLEADLDSLATRTRAN